MYKLLLVSDQEDVLQAFALISNWGYNGFNPPHIRHDLEGAQDSLRKHHADGIIIAVDPEEEERLMAWLEQAYPMLPICEAGTTPSEVSEHLGELRTLLNQVNADFSSDTFDDRQKMLRLRRHLFRSMVGGRKINRHTLRQEMRLLRSRMDPDRPCILMDLDHSSADDDLLIGKLQDCDHLLERELYQSFGGDIKGYHVLPLVTKNGDVFVLAGPIRGEEQSDDMVQILNNCVEDGIRHAAEYRGLHLRITGIQVLPSMYAFCVDYAGQYRRFSNGYSEHHQGAADRRHRVVRQLQHNHGAQV